MVGDVDNSASITMNDVTLIQRHISQYSSLSNEALQLADVDGDGRVNSFDATYIQRVVANIDEGFDNGIYSFIES